MCEVFLFMGNVGKYLDFRKSWLYIKVKIINLDGMVYVNLEKKRDY